MALYLLVLMPLFEVIRCACNRAPLGVLYHCQWPETSTNPGPSLFQLKQRTGIRRFYFQHLVLHSSRHEQTLVSHLRYLQCSTKSLKHPVQNWHVSNSEFILSRATWWTSLARYSPSLLLQSAGTPVRGRPAQDALRLRKVASPAAEPLGQHCTEGAGWPQPPRGGSWPMDGRRPRRRSARFRRWSARLRAAVHFRRLRRRWRRHAREVVAAASFPLLPLMLGSRASTGAKSAPV